MDIGKSIRVGIAQAGHRSVKEWCEAHGLNRPTVSQAMTGKKNPTLATMQNYAKTFNVPLSKFIEWGE